jgi:hypothetical protein
MLSKEVWSYEPGSVHDVDVYVDVDVHMYSVPGQAYT